MIEITGKYNSAKVLVEDYCTCKEFCPFWKSLNKIKEIKEK